MHANSKIQLLCEVSHTAMSGLKVVAYRSRLPKPDIEADTSLDSMSQSWHVDKIDRIILASSRSHNANTRESSFEKTLTYRRTLIRILARLTRHVGARQRLTPTAGVP